MDLTATLIAGWLIWAVLLSLGITAVALCLYLIMTAVTESLKRY